MSGWLQANCPEVEFINAPQGKDWRDAAVNAALDISDADRVWFTEQDFFIDGPAFWGVQGAVVGFSAGDGRLLHPASLTADRGLVDRTSRYFGPDPVDHFYTFGEELARLAPLTLLPGGFRHMQGVTQNHALIDRGEDAGVFRRGDFRGYLRDCLSAGVPLEGGWEDRARREVLPEES